MVTVDEGDRFAGGVGMPQTDGTLGVLAHELLVDDDSGMPVEPDRRGQPEYQAYAAVGYARRSVHNDSAPTFYVNGKPDRADPMLRNIERDVAGLNAIDPYASSTPAPVFVRMADAVGEKTLHMVNSDPARTPSFTAFGDPNWFLTGGTVANPTRTRRAAVTRASTTTSPGVTATSRT